jgi:membrane-bound lytic murein transglycosylase
LSPSPSGKRPYFDGKVLRRNQAACAEHRAFVSVDSMALKEDSKKRYALLAKSVLEPLNENCVAVFSPELNGMVPNDDSLRVLLRNMAASYGSSRI